MMWLRLIGFSLLVCLVTITARFGLADDQRSEHSPRSEQYQRQEHDVRGGYRPDIQVLEDAEHILSASSLHQLADLRWQSFFQETPSFGFSQSTYWVRFSHQNTTHKRQQLYIDVGYPLLNEVTLYQFSHSGNQAARTIGNTFPFQYRPVQHRNLIFPVTVAAQDTDEFFLRVQSSSALQFPIRIWQPADFYAEDQYSLILHGVYYGIVLIVVLYHLFLYLQIRDETYLFFALYVSTFSVAQMALTGFGYQLLWPDWPSWNQLCIAVITPVMVGFGCMFARAALKLQERAPLSGQLAILQAVTGIVLMGASFTFPYSIMIKLVAVLAIAACVWTLFASGYFWLRHGERFAAYFTVAWAVFLLGVVSLALNKFGIIPRTFFTEFAVQIGSAVEIVLLSYALTERLRAANSLRLQTEQEARVANEKNLEVQRDITVDLEKKFREKTQELEAALEKVQLLNTELTEISQTDQLTGARNRRFMDAYLVREVKRAQRSQQPLSLIMIDIDHFKSVNDQYGHPVGDLCLKMVTHAIMGHLRRCQDEICRYGGEEMAIILPDTSLQGALHRAESIRKSVEALLIDTGSTHFSVTISAGVSATSCINVKDALTLTTGADQALYQAKRAGRNRVRLLDTQANVHWLHTNKD